MCVGEIRVKQIRVKQGLGVICLTPVKLSTESSHLESETGFFKLNALYSKWPLVFWLPLHRHMTNF